MKIQLSLNRLTHLCVQVSDFGLARRADIHVPNEGGKFPVKWTAPESMKESVSMPYLHLVSLIGIGSCWGGPA